MDKQIEKVLEEIFEPFTVKGIDHIDELNKSPSFAEIKDLAELIVLDGPEEDFQKFLSKNPHFLFRLALSTDETLMGILAKPPIGNFHVADYAIITISQGGCIIRLIEIEKPSDKLFTSKLTPAKKFQTALGQVADWKQWIHNNQQSVVNSCLELLKRAPKYFDRKEGGSFRYYKNENLKSSWDAFGGDELCLFEYVIVIGRWSKLNEAEKKRFIYLDREHSKNNLTVRTYENFIRKVLDGQKYFF